MALLCRAALRLGSRLRSPRWPLLSAFAASSPPSWEVSAGSSRSRPGVAMSIPIPFPQGAGHLVLRSQAVLLQEMQQLVARTTQEEEPTPLQEGFLFPF